MASQEKYVCTLDAESVKKAKLELNEEPSERENALKEFRDWIKCQSDWLKTPTDTLFLLSFLRKNKFSQIAAREALAEYWVCRGKYPKYCSNVDVMDPAYQKVIKSGHVVVLPSYDKHGRMVLLFNFDKIQGLIDDPDITPLDLPRAITSILDAYLLDERTQVNGHIQLIDFSQATMEGFTFATESAGEAVATASNVYPLRWRQMHFYLPPGDMLDDTMTIMKNSAPDKVVKRIHIHKTMEGIYSDLGMAVFPKEYLPADYTGEHAGSLQDVGDKFVSYMTRPDVVERLRDLSSGKYGVDETKRPSVLAGMVRMTANIMQDSLHK